MFPLLASPRHRSRVNLISDLAIKRRADCEPTLHSLVTDEWTLETIHHIGWCDSCRTAGFALDVGAFAGGRAEASPNRGRAVMVAVIAAAAIVVPAVASQSLDNPFGNTQGDALRGGYAHVVKHPLAHGSHGKGGPTASSGAGKGTGAGKAAGSGKGAGAANGKGASGAGATGSKPPTKIIPRSRTGAHGSAASAHHATTLASMSAAHRELPHTT